MLFKEEKGDLFICSSDTSLAHCISECVNMGAGIAIVFKKKFGRVDEIKRQNIKTGGVAYIQDGERFVFYLITKERYFHKPSYTSLKNSLFSLRELILKYNIKKLALPRIGCGLDKLDWKIVVLYIFEIFADVNIDITVYSLQ